MSTTQFNFKILVQRTGLPDYTVRYRIDTLRKQGNTIGKDITKTFTLYSDSDVKQIMAFSKGVENV